MNGMRCESCDRMDRMVQGGMEWDGADGMGLDGMGWDEPRCLFLRTSVR